VITHTKGVSAAKVISYASRVAPLLAGILLSLPVVATETDSSSSSLSASHSAEQERAIDVAKNKIAKDLKIQTEELQVVSIEPHTWPNSGLGCAAPGSMAAQVITPGYIIKFNAASKKYIVHATDTYAVRCEHDMLLRNPRAVSVPLKNLDAMIDKAKADLAEKLRVQPSTIRMLRFTPMEWPDTSMECVVTGEAIEQKVTRGYRIALNHAGRTYVYHTDMERVRACPAIEAE
jgi:hypothetical protein